MIINIPVYGEDENGNETVEYIKTKPFYGFLVPIGLFKKITVEQNNNADDTEVNNGK